MKTSNKSTDTDDLIVDEPSTAITKQHVRREQQKSTHRIKREPKPRRRAKKAKKSDEGIVECIFRFNFC